MINPNYYNNYCCDKKYERNVLKVFIREIEQDIKKKHFTLNFYIAVGVLIFYTRVNGATIKGHVHSVTRRE